ncbi:MAG: hypothetical protein LBG76_02215 [Treponema sp.]|jgi:hypothetical protein|nr:hypothetical protein [Treponema sp.]
MVEFSPDIFGIVPVMLELNEAEKRLVEDVEAYLEAHAVADSVLVRNRFASLEALGSSISQFPSIQDVQVIRGESRDKGQLLEALCEFAPSSHLLHIPTRVVAARSYLVAKCHAFTFLSLLVHDTEFSNPIRRVIFSIICTLMAEEVYFSCLKDPAFPEEIKRRLACDLISLWDKGTDPRTVAHLPALETLWTARDETPPCFGTMDGTSELIRLSINMGKDWENFLVTYMDDDNTRWALEEFLFGLSYEEIQEVRARLSRFGILAVGLDEVRSYLGTNPAYTIVKSSDPRAIYDFYVDRRDAAAYRKRSSAPGPWKPLEEMYLRFRLTHNLEYAE